MNGQMRKFNYNKYYKSCEETGELIKVDKSVKLNLKDLISYAKKRNTSIDNLSMEERMQFVIRM